jgi:DNA-directed RNA polymerase specialized sigma24 family protein
MTEDYRIAELKVAASLDHESLSKLQDGLPHRRTLRRLVHNILKEDVVVDDVLQDVHLAAWLHVSTPGGPPIGNLKQWLSRAARNRALDYLRQRRREVPLPEGEAIAERDED